MDGLSGGWIGRDSLGGETRSSGNVPLGGCSLARSLQPVLGGHSGR